MKGETIVFTPNQVIFREGDPCNGVYFIKEGKVEVFRERDGLSVSFGHQNAGEVLGTLSIFTRESRSASAKAVSQVTMLHVNSDNLELGIKGIPVWALALLKDTINRLKFVDERLVESKLTEKKLKTRVGTNLSHGAQMAAFLGSLMRLGSINEDGIELFPLRGFVNRCENVLQRRAEYLELIFGCFSQSGLIKLVEDKKFGPSISKPKAPLIEDFGIFCSQAQKSEMKGFASTKIYPYMSALGRALQKFGEKEFYTMEELVAELSKEMGRQVSEGIFAEMQMSGVIRPNGKGQYSFNSQQSARRIVFEGTCRLIKEINESEEFSKPAAAQKAG